jgi:uncharacterized protein YcfJ
MKQLKCLFIGLVTLTVTACASTGTPMYYVDAKVIKKERAPEICEKKDDGNALIGALLGGAVGNQFGKGKGRVAMTAVGAVIGANSQTERDPRKRGKMTCKRNGYINTVAYIHPVTQQMVTTTVKTDRWIRGDYINIPVK